MTTKNLPAVVLDPRFNGPPSTANGGYAAGMAAVLAGGASEVTLHSPPPLGRQLAVEYDGEGSIRVLDGDVLVLSTRPADEPPPLEAPVRPTFDEGIAAAARHVGHGQRHMMSDCVICSPYREDSFGLHPGPLAGHEEIGAAAFVPRDDLADQDGHVRPEFIWGALDCPSYTPAQWESDRPSMLVRMSATIGRPIAAGERIVAVGWRVAAEGRKTSTASALIDDAGEVVAAARVLWIALRA